MPRAMFTTAIAQTASDIRADGNWIAAFVRKAAAAGTNGVKA